MLPREILIILGGYDLDKKFETGRETVAPIRIHMHPDWNPSVQSFDGDISLYELEQAIQFTNFILPICWWQSPSDPQVNVGTVVGYGRSEDQTKIHENIPKVIQLPIHSQETCFLSQPTLAKLASPRTFCAGKGDNTGVCSGDSGGGLIINVNGVYYLRGIVSSSLVKDFTCDVSNYAVFTNVLKYKEWIYKTMGIRPPQTLPPRPQTIPPIVNTVRPTPNTFVTQQNLQNLECGVMSSSAGLIQGGRFASRVQFPWMVSLVISYSNFNLNSSGALISRKHIVTAGTAVSFYGENTRSYGAISLHRIKIFLGALTQNDPSAALFNAAAIALHPNIKEVDETAINNVAVVTLSTLVPFNDWIRPICLWALNDELRYVSGSPFYSVGYGVDESGKVSNVRKYSRVSLVDLPRCERGFGNYPNIFHETNVFCVQGSSSESPCDFDDFLFVKFNERWYLRGLLLLNFHFDNFNTCNYGEPILFQDMAQHVRWIQSQVI